MSSDSRLSDGIIQLQFWSPLSLATVFVVMVVICGISGLRYNIFLHGPHQSFQTKIATVCDASHKFHTDVNERVKGL